MVIVRVTFCFKERLNFMRIPCAALQNLLDTILHSRNCKQCRNRQITEKLGLGFFLDSLSPPSISSQAHIQGPVPQI